MIWACFSVCGLTFVAFVSENKNGEKYTRTVQDNFLLFVNEDKSDGYVFMQG